MIELTSFYIHERERPASEHMGLANFFMSIAKAIMEGDLPITDLYKKHSLKSMDAVDKITGRHYFCVSSRSDEETSAIEFMNALLRESHPADMFKEFKADENISLRGILENRFRLGWITREASVADYYTLFSDDLDFAIELGKHHPDIFDAGIVRGAVLNNSIIHVKKIIKEMSLNPENVDPKLLDDAKTPEMFDTLLDLGVDPRKRYEFAGPISAHHFSCKDLPGFGQPSKKDNQIIPDLRMVFHIRSRISERFHYDDLTLPYRGRRGENIEYPAKILIDRGLMPKTPDRF